MSSDHTTSTFGSPSREYPQYPIASAHAIVFRGGKVLLVKRARQPNQGRWSIPGGMVELGETLHDAARRELREECGVEIEVDKVINAVDIIIPDEIGHIRFHYIVIYLLVRYVSGKAHPNSDALEVLLATREELDALDMHPIARRTAQQAFEVMNSCHG